VRCGAPRVARSLFRMVQVISIACVVRTKNGQVAFQLTDRAWAALFKRACSGREGPSWA